MTEINIINYLLDIAPALGISFIALYYLWKQYSDQIKYQREQDKNNLEVLMNLSTVLQAFEKASSEDNGVIKKTISDEASRVREHIDIRIGELKK